MHKHLDFSGLNFQDYITVDYISNVHVIKLFESKIIIIFLSIILNMFLGTRLKQCFVCLFCCFLSQSTAMVMGDGKFS